MSSTFGSFEAAKSGLSVSMQQLNVTEQNITNVNTEGYTRQRILTSAKEPTSSTYLIAQLNKASVGQGVEATGVQQIRSTYLDQQYRSLNSSYSYSNTRDTALTYLDGLFNENNDDSSLTTAIGNFFSALNTFSEDTSSKENRTNVQKQAQSMTESFRNVYEEMQSLWQDQNESISTSAQQINSIAQKIANLNDSIAKSEQTGGTANDLNDQRNLLLDQLSSYVNITYSPNSQNNSMIDVQIGGQTLVEGKTTNEVSVDVMSNHETDIDNVLSIIADPTTDAATMSVAIDQLKSYGDFDISQSDPSNPSSSWIVKLGGQTLVSDNTVNMKVADAAANDMGAWAAYTRNNLSIENGTAPLSIKAGTVTGGELYANMEMVSSNDSATPGIPFYMDQLNDLVRDIAKNINDIHQKGYSYPDGTSDSKNDVIFFKVPPALDGSGNPITTVENGNTYTVYDYSKLNAGNFDLSDAVLQSVYNIAGSSNPIDLTSSTPESGNDEIALKLVQDLSNSGYYDKLNSIVGNLSITSNTNANITSTKQSLLNSVDTQRKSVSAVSLDEETTNLIVFQQSYNAASRVITTLDDMLNTMINKMGLTGT